MWEEFYRLFQPELLRYACSICPSRELAEDLTQEAFLRALQNVDKLEALSRSQRRAWLYKTLKNLLCDHYRGETLANRYVCEVEPDAAAEEHGYARLEDQALLVCLSPQNRILFQMRYVEGYTAAELAEIFQMPSGTIRARLSRSRAVLRAALEKD